MRMRWLLVAGLLAGLLCCKIGATAQSKGDIKGRTDSSLEQIMEEARKGVKSIQPKNGFVPDEVTAVKIAEAVLVPIYGENQVKSERPFRATLKNGVWTVMGTLAPQLVGGTAEVRIAKVDGRILFVNHWM